MIFMEKMNMSLETFMLRAKTPKKPFMNILPLTVVVLVKSFVAWKTMHINHLLHMDAHSGNFLISGVNWDNGHASYDPWQCKVKLTDFGRSCRIQEVGKNLIELSCAAPGLVVGYDKTYEFPLASDVFTFFTSTCFDILDELYNIAMQDEQMIFFKPQLKKIMNDFYDTRDYYGKLMDEQYISKMTIEELSLEGEQVIITFLKNLVHKINAPLAITALKEIRTYMANKGL